VTAGPAEARDDSLFHWVLAHLKDNWNGPGRHHRGTRCRRATRNDHAHPTADQFGCQRRQIVVGAPAKIELHSAALNKAPFAQGLEKRGRPDRPKKKPDYRHRRLLRARSERPRCRVADQRDDLSPPHSITSSARASRLSGTVRPSSRAVWALITNSNFEGCTTGRSAGFSPLRMRPAYTPT